MTHPRQALDAALEVAAAHRRRMEEALAHLSHRLPMSPAAVEQLTYEDLITHLGLDYYADGMQG